MRDIDTMNFWMVLAGILIVFFVGFFIGLFVLDNSQYGLLKSEWTCVEAKQINENADNLECINYKKEK
jgi:hypothetical protein